MPQLRLYKANEMNDFTKEELKELTQIISHYRGLTDDMSQVYLPLYKKIQSMIDNYCEVEDIDGMLAEHLQE